MTNFISTAIKEDENQIHDQVIQQEFDQSHVERVPQLQLPKEEMKQESPIPKKARTKPVSTDFGGGLRTSRVGLKAF